MAGGDQPDIDRYRPRATDTPHRRFLDDAQQPCLQSKRHFRNLIKKQRAAMSLLEPPCMLPDRAGKGTTFVPEQFGFDQLRCNRATIDRDERAAGPRAGGMDCACDDVLAGAGRPDQNGGAATWPEPLHQGAQRDHGLRSPDDHAGHGWTGAKSSEGGIVTSR